MFTQGARERRCDPARRWMNDNAGTVVVGCVAMLAVSLQVLSWHLASTAGRSRPTHAWYYDSTNRQIVTRPVDLPPTLIEEGRELWRLHVFACGDCSQEPMEYYERCAPEHRERYEALCQKWREGVMTWDEELEYLELQSSGRQYSRDGVTWRPLAPGAEDELAMEFERACRGSAVRVCFPQAGVR